MYALHLQHASEAELLLDRSIALDAELGRKSMAARTFCILSSTSSRTARCSRRPIPSRLAIFRQTTDLGRAARGRPASFVDGLRAKSGYYRTNSRIPGLADRRGCSAIRGAFHRRSFDLEPALLHRRMPPPSQAIDSPHLVEDHLLRCGADLATADDLPHAAGQRGTSHA